MGGSGTLVIFTMACAATHNGRMCAFSCKRETMERGCRPTFFGIANEFHRVVHLPILVRRCIRSCISRMLPWLDHVTLLPRRAEPSRFDKGDMDIPRWGKFFREGFRESLQGCNPMSAFHLRNMTWWHVPNLLAL